MKKWISILMIIILAVSMAGCAQDNTQKDKVALEKITLLLDWVPNTNHTGLYVAKNKGYFEEEGLDVDIFMAGEGGAAEQIANGDAEFGISYQEQVTYALTSEKTLPIKAIAAIIQHNTSGFAAPASKGILSPADFENKKYGGWGSPMEAATIKGLMDQYDSDYSKVEMVNIGADNFFSATEGNVDFTWIYFGWDGVAAQLKNVDINFIKLQDIDEDLDFYTPVIIANANQLDENPELAKRVLRAVSKGYEFSIENPEQAGDILLEYAPELDRELVIESQAYLANEYRAEAEQWGVMKEEIWQNYSNWMYKQGLLEKELDTKLAYTNAFLPER